VALLLAYTAFLAGVDRTRYKDYADAVWDNLSQADIDDIEKVGKEMFL